MSLDVSPVKILILKIQIKKHSEIENADFDCVGV